MTEDRWQQAVIEAMERLVGAEHGAQIAAEWDAHVARGKVEVTFLGPYSSGKSTLLRRLVVEGNGDIPDWLTVSARRETFELNTVDVGDLTFTDAPGFAAGNDLHDALAQEALVLSDAFLLVLPPQLLTTNRELVASIVSGEYFFGSPVSGSDRAVIAVIAQADSMGPDPEDDIDAMRRLAERKRSELIAQLESTAGVPLPNLQVFCVAADPYEEQARRSHPDKRDFDPYRAWDGIAPLTAALDALTVRQTALRRSAGSRYFCRVAGEVASQAQAVLDELHASAEEMRARQTDWEQQKARVDALISAAEANLHSVLISLATELSEEVGGDATKSRSQVDDRMTITLENWAQRWDGELDLVLGEAKAHVDDRLGRVRALRTEEFLRSIANETVSTEAPDGSSRIVGLLNKINGDLHDTARKALEFYANTPIERLLDVSERSKSDFAKRTAETAKDASAKSLKTARTLAATLEVVEGVLAVATILDAERRQHDADVQRRRAREEARKRIEVNAKTASSQIVNGSPGVPGWRARADSSLDQLRDQLKLTNDTAAIDNLLDEVATRQRLIADLRRLLDEAPPLPSALG